MPRTLKIAAAFVLLLVAAGTAMFTVPQISEKALEWTCSLKAPSESCVKRMRAMGHVWSLKNNLEKAKVWYTRAAEHGDVPAMFHLAWIYEQDGNREREAAYEERREKVARGVSSDDLGQPPAPRSFVRAAEWYRKAADGKFAPAMNNLGELYMAGSGVPLDLNAGFRWMLAGARAGNPIASWNVVGAYWNRSGVEFDKAEADKWSVWTPKGMTDDLADLTLQRTNMTGEGIPLKNRQHLRAAAEKGVPVTYTLSPLQPNPALPTFEQARR